MILMVLMNGLMERSLEFLIDDAYLNLIKIFRIATGLPWLFSCKKVSVKPSDLHR